MPTNQHNVSFQHRTESESTVRRFLRAFFRILQNLWQTYLINVWKKVLAHQYSDTIEDPIHKGSDQCCTANYRPISLVNHLSQILEMILKERLIISKKKHSASGKEFQHKMRYYI